MNVAVFLPNWVGDAVMATPAIRALRQHFASARLIAVLRPYVAGVLEGSNWFDQMVFANGSEWPPGMIGVAWQLRRLDIDLAVLFPNSFRTAFTAWVGGCRRRVGYARSGRSVLLTDRLLPVRDGWGRRLPSPIIDDYNRLAQEVGCARPGYRLELFTTPRDEAGADAVWQQTRLGDAPEVVCLNPGAAFGSAK